MRTIPRAEHAFWAPDGCLRYVDSAGIVHELEPFSGRDKKTAAKAHLDDMDQWSLLTGGRGRLHVTLTSGLRSLLGHYAVTYRSQASALRRALMQDKPGHSTFRPQLLRADSLVLVVRGTDTRLGMLLQAGSYGETEVATSAAMSRTGAAVAVEWSSDDPKERQSLTMRRKDAAAVVLPRPSKERWFGPRLLWLPDERHLLYEVIERDLAHQHENLFEIWLADAVSGARKRLASGQAAAYVR